MLSRGNKIVAPAASIAFVCFFLPWITVSCSGQPVESASGFQLAKDVNSPELYLVLLAALGVLAVVFLVYRGTLELKTAAYISIGLAAVGLLIVLVKFFSLRSQLNQATDMSMFSAMARNLGLGDLAGISPDLVEIQIKYGLWGMSLALIAVIVGAVLDVTGDEKYGFDSPVSSFPPPPDSIPPTIASPPGPPPIQTASPVASSPPVEQTRHFDARPPAKAWLVVQSGPLTGKQYGVVVGRNIIGRDGGRCDLIIEGDMISGQHAQVRYENGQFVLYDMASTNGTYVNNRRIQREPLMDNDIVRLGNTNLVFKTV